MCLLFNFYKENAVREWSFKRAITIQTYGGYDPIPVPLNIIYRIYRLLRLCTKKFKKEEDVRVKTAIGLRKRRQQVFAICVCLCLSVFIM